MVRPIDPARRASAARTEDRAPGRTPTASRISRGAQPIIIALVIAVAATVLTPIPAAAEPASAHVPPVDAPVIDAFRPPSHPYGPGNRGVDFWLDATTPVRASADGEVIFAGPVGGEFHVTVAHPDGLRTSYSFVSAIRVGVGDTVAQGDVVAHARGQLHFGVRGPFGHYLDPALLFAEVETRVRLVPHHEPAATAPASILHEHAHLLAVVASERGGPSLLDRVSGALANAIRTGFDALLAVAPDLVDEFLATFDALVALADAIHDIATLEVVVDVVFHLWDALTRECTEPGAAVADARRRAAERGSAGRVALLVGGYGSHAGGGVAVDGVDTDALGYGDEVLRFSYGGGVVPGTPGSQGRWADLPTSTYEPVDTDGDIAVAGAELAATIRAIQAADPGVVVDVYAHSMGGLTTRVALEQLADSGQLGGVGQVVTMGTPHQGSDLANSAVVAMVAADLAAFGVAAVAHAGGAHMNPSADSVRQMTDGSRFLIERDLAGIPDGVDFLAIGHRSDLVVAGDHALVDGHDWAIIDEVDGLNSHAALPGLEATTDEIALALVDLPPVCDGFWTAFADIGYAGLVSFGADLFTIQVAVFGSACRWCSWPMSPEPTRTG